METTLPLKSRTPDAWGVAALQRPLELLADHALLERKAAGNALEMLDRWPERSPPPFWVEKMTAIAREEIDHLAIVSKLLTRRGGRLPRHHRNPYASALRKLVRSGQAERELVDRLLVSALIELRSAERFFVLARVSDDDELTRLYTDLWASENGHYLTFLQLAQRVGPRAAIEQRWDELLTAEAEILAAQPAGPRMHSGAANS